MQTIQKYAYLWDGSESGWTLLKIYKQNVSILLSFSSDGPTTKDIKLVRECLPYYSALPASVVAHQLRGKTSLDVGGFESKEGRRVANRCRAAGLVVETIGSDSIDYLPYNEETKITVIIEDEELSQCVAKEAILHGVTIKVVEA